MSVRIVHAMSACLIGVIACGERSTSPQNGPPVASVVIVPASASLEVARQQPLYVTLRDQTGNVLQGRAVQWQSSLPSVATVTAGADVATATVAAIAPGTAIITATSEGKTAATTITVTAIPSTDFAIVDAQWTQGVQQADGAIPMILGGSDAVLNVSLSTTAVNRAPGQLVLTLSLIHI